MSVRENQNAVFDQQLYHCGLLAAAFHQKHGGVRMSVRDDGKDSNTSIHEPLHADPVAPVEPHVWRHRAEEYFRVCDIPPDECVVVTRYSSDGSGQVYFQRKKKVVVSEQEKKKVPKFQGSDSSEWKPFEFQDYNAGWSFERMGFPARDANRGAKFDLGAADACEQARHVRMHDPELADRLGFP